MLLKIDYTLPLKFKLHPKGILCLKWKYRLEIAKQLTFNSYTNYPVERKMNTHIFLGCSGPVM